MAGAALFEPGGAGVFAPTEAAVGAWDREIVHGAPVAALFAGQLAPAEHTLARLTVEFLAPVPHAPLTLELSSLDGGARVQRQRAALVHEGRTVATATSVVVRRGELDLPDKARRHDSPFDPAELPALETRNLASEELIGWPSYDSQGVYLAWTRIDGDPRPHGWIRLALPVVAGTEISGIETAAVAADYAQSAINFQLPYREWSFRNAELTLHLSREPVGDWIGLRSEGVVQPVGAGFNAADLFDADGRVGRSASSLVVERRSA
ncbi:thioesterase family protein [Aquihabitans sp. McL0605]|uniref:thioesterase family protein n=1 Tax=Aquihabitans sp. McL0605 TaxID=3415671 RepID=UPI003CEC9A5D